MNAIDFLPKRIRQQRRRRRTLGRQGVLVGLCAAGLSVLACLNQARVASAKSDLDTKQANCRAVQEQIKTLPAQEAALREARLKVRIGAELGSRLDLQAVLAEISRMLPEGAGLLSLDCGTVAVPVSRPSESPSAGGAVQPARTGKPPIQSTAEPRLRLTLTGVAPTDVDAANFMQKLQACPLFQDVDMAYTRTVLVDQDRRKARNFQVKPACWPGRPAADPKAAPARRCPCE